MEEARDTEVVGKETMGERKSDSVDPALMMLKNGMQSNLCNVILNFRKNFLKTSFNT